MKIKFSLPVLMALAIVMVLAGCCAKAHAAARTFNGSIGIETPLGVPDRPQDNSPTVKFDLHLKNFVGPVGLYGGANVNTNKGFPWDKENKFWTGVEMPVGNQGLVAYSYFERRFDTNDNRFMIGAKYNFHGGY